MEGIRMYVRTHADILLLAFFKPTLLDNVFSENIQNTFFLHFTKLFYKKNSKYYIAKYFLNICI